MKRFLSQKRFAFARLILGFLIPLLLTSATRGADIWDGGSTGPGDDYWSTATNWVDDIVPTFPTALTFGGTTRLNPTNDLSGVTVNGITYAAGAGAFTLRGNPITLAGNISVTAGGSVTNTQVVNLDMALGASPTLNTTLRGPLVFNGVLSGPFGLTSQGTGYVQFNGLNTYSGDTVFNNETFVSIGSVSPFGSGLVKFGSVVGSAQQWIVASGADRTITNNVDINTVLFVAHNAAVAGKASGNLTLSGNVLIHSASGFYCNANLAVTGPIRGGSSAVNFFELRSGKLSLLGNNSFTNTIIITNPGYGTARILNINSDAALGYTNNGVRFDTGATIQIPATTNVTLATSRVFNILSTNVATFDIPSGSSLTLSGPVTNSGSLSKVNSGALTLLGASTYSGGTAIRGGILGVRADSSLGAVPPSPATNLFFATSGTLRSEANHALTVNRMLVINTNVVATFDTQGYTQTVNGVLSGAPGSWLYKSGNGTLVLNPGADKTNSVSSLRNLAGTLLYSSGTHLITTNTVWNQYKVYDTLYVNGGTVLVGGGLLMTTGSGYATIQNGSLLVTNGTVNLNSMEELLNAYSGTGNTTVGGNGVLDLRVLRITQSGTPAVSNVVNVNAGGTLRLNYFNIDTGQVAPYGTVNLNGGTLVAKMSAPNFMGYNVPKWVTNVFFNVLSGGAVIDSDTNNITIQLPLYSGSENDGGLTKKGAGMLTLANTNTYNGATSVEAGTLKLSLANTLLSGGSVSVASNAVFDLSGTVQTLSRIGGGGTVTNLGALTVTDTITPGDAGSFGTLTFASAPASITGCNLAVNVSTNGACGCLHVRGDLNLATLSLSVGNAEQLAKFKKYTIATCTGTLGIPFNSVGTLPSRWVVKYDTVNKQTYLSYNFGTLISVR